MNVIGAGTNSIDMMMYAQTARWHSAYRIGTKAVAPDRFANAVNKPSPMTAATATMCCVVSACTTSSGGDTSAGKRLFETQCVDCHVAEPGDGGGMQGPSLIGVIGRRAGADANFPYYSQPLRDSGLIWDATSLDRFLAAPEQTVPGTMMVLSVTKPEDRQDLIAYFEHAAAAR